MVSGVKVLQKADEVSHEKQTWTKMAESESIKEVVNHTVIQAATVVIMTFRDTDTGP